MTYLIIAGIGFSVGIVLLIWALNERKQRYKAQEKVIELQAHCTAAEAVALSNELSVNKLMESYNRLSDENNILRQRITTAYDHMSLSDDPAVIKQWLLAELKAEEI